MSGERLEVNVTFDSARGYIASAPELRQPIVALSLTSLRKRIEALLMPEESGAGMTARLAGRARVDQRAARGGLHAWEPCPRKCFEDPG